MPLALIAFLGLLFALVPAGIVQVQLEREARDTRARDLEAQAMQLASLVGRQVASTLDSARHTLRTMAAHEDIRRLEASAACDLFLQRVVAVAQRYATANVFDREGNALCAADPAVLAVNVGDRRYFRETLRTGEMRLGEYTVGRASGQASLHLSQPLRDSGGAVAGVLVVALSVDWLNDELHMLLLPEGGVAIIADREGTIVARSSAREEFVGRRLGANGLAVLRAATPGVMEATLLDGVARTVAYLPLGSEPEGLFVAVGLDTASAIAAQGDANLQAAIMVVGSLLLTFVVGLVFFNAAVDRPVQRLLRAANHWARQDWNTRVGHLRGGREFQRLAAAFDALADTVVAREAARRRALTRMEAVVGVAPQIVMTADRAGHVDWTNPYWQELTGFDTARSLGLGWMEATHPEDRPGLRAAWEAMVASGLGAGAEGFSHEVRLRRAADRQWRWFLMKAAAVRHEAADITAWALVGVDFHELRVIQAQAEDTAAQLRATYENAPVGLCLLDRELRYIAINDMLAGIHGATAQAHIGRRLAEVAPHMSGLIEEAMRRVVATGEPVEELEVTGEVDGQPRVWLASYRPIFGADGGLTCVTGSVVDITARKRVEESERLLSREVDHRAQNALAVVRGLIRLSAADAPDDVPALVEVLEGRIAAMSRAHTLLSREKWVGAELGEIVREEFAPQSGRILAEGPPVRLTAEAAQPLTLVLHELVTNALKYGALSVPEGQVSLRWARQQDKLRMEWVEQGGPPMTAIPSRRGFGTRLIDANIRGLLAGDIERDWAEAGLRCTLVLGAEALAGSRFLTGLRGAAPLDGRRVIVAVENPEEARGLVEALRASGCAVLGPAASIEEAVELIEAAKRVDAAVLSGTLQGRSAQPLAQLVRRRATALLFLNTLGLDEGDGPAPRLLAPPHTARSVRRALVEALEAARARPGTSAHPAAPAPPKPGPAS